MFELWRRAYGQRARRVRDYWKRLLDEDAAHARGERLLREWLSPAQRAQFDAIGCFEVVGCHTGTRYRIRHGTAGNVDELDENGLAQKGWCFVPQGSFVPGDVMLAQKISLETDERAALAVANRFPSTAVARHNHRVARRQL
jgi:hypothetical protein